MDKLHRPFAGYPANPVRFIHGMFSAVSLINPAGAPVGFINRIQKIRSRLQSQVFGLPGQNSDFGDSFLCLFKAGFWV
jgi:hypothetical protein